MRFGLSRREYLVAYYAEDSEGNVHSGVNIPRAEWETMREHLRGAGYNIVAKHHRRPIVGPVIEDQTAIAAMVMGQGELPEST